VVLLFLSLSNFGNKVGAGLLPSPGSGLIVMRSGIANRYLLKVLRVIILFGSRFVVVAIGDMVFGFPGVEFLVVASPLDEAELSV